MQFRLWLEATTTYNKKLVDPALMTQQEYYEFLNPKKKCHPSDAYQMRLGQTLDKDSKELKEKTYPILLQNKIINGITFEFRLSKQDRAEQKYVKSNDEREIIRDEKGKALYYTKEELINKFGRRRYNYEIGIFNQQDGYIGGSSDEWGCVLIQIVDEYKGFGLGTILSKMVREHHPDKDSGGFTESGYRTFKKVHKSFVQDYLSSGMYSHLVKTGQVSVERVKKIIDSTSGVKQNKIESINLKLDDPKNWLMHVDDGSFIIYDKKLKSLLDNNDYFWQQKAIKGLLLVRANSDYARIIQFGGENDKIKKYLIALAAMYATKENLPLVIEETDFKYVDQKVIEIEDKPSVAAGTLSRLARFKGTLFDVNILGAAENKFRKSFDKHDEFYVQMAELAYGKYSP